MPDPSISWLIISICIILSFFFSCSETAFSCCNHFKIQVDADEGNKTARVIIKICNKFERSLTTILIGNNVVAIAISAISTILFMNYLKGTGLNDYASLISSLIMTFVVYIIGDTLPKTIAKAIPDTMSYFFAWPVYILTIILTPINFIFELFSKAIDKIFKVKDEDEVTEEELESAIEKASDDETIEEEQAEIVQSALDFIDTKVKDVLTPRDKIVAVNIQGLTHEKLQEIFSTTNYSRIPIYDKVFDNFIGVIHIKIYFEAYEKDPNVSIKSLLQKPYFVTPDIMIDDLFNGFKKRKTHIAMVRDKHNSVVGMVTMEDVLEELVSDISEPVAKKRKKVI